MNKNYITVQDLKRKYGLSTVDILNIIKTREVIAFDEIGRKVVNIKVKKDCLIDNVHVAYCEYEDEQMRLRCDAILNKIWSKNEKIFVLPFDERDAITLNLPIDKRFNIIERLQFNRDEVESFLNKRDVKDNNEKSKTEDEECINPKRKTSYLILIDSLCARLGIDPCDRNSTDKLARDIEQNGYSLSKDVIRIIRKEIQEVRRKNLKKDF